MSNKLPHMTTSVRGEDEWSLHLRLDVVAVDQTEGADSCAGCVFAADEPLAPLCSTGGGECDFGRPDCSSCCRRDGREIVWKHRADVEPERITMAEGVRIADETLRRAEARRAATATAEAAHWLDVAEPEPEEKIDGQL